MDSIVDCFLGVEPDLFIGDDDDFGGAVVKYSVAIPALPSVMGRYKNVHAAQTLSEAYVFQERFPSGYLKIPWKDYRQPRIIKEEYQAQVVRVLERRVVVVENLIA